MVPARRKDGSSGFADSILDATTWGLKLQAVRDFRRFPESLKKFDLPLEVKEPIDILLLLTQHPQGCIQESERSFIFEDWTAESPWWPAISD